MADEPQDPKAVRAEETALAADLSAEHAAAATKQAEDDAAAALKAANKNRPSCLHCGRLLRFENDLGGHLHCDGPACIGCCFDPGPPLALRSNAPLCPAMA